MKTKSPTIFVLFKQEDPLTDVATKETSQDQWLQSHFPVTILTVIGWNKQKKLNVLQNMDLSPCKEGLKIEFYLFNLNTAYKQIHNKHRIKIVIITLLQ